MEKKLYTKPVAVMQSFQLDAEIAGACTDKGATAVNLNETTCALDDGLFASTACILNVKETGDGNNGICYHTLVDINMYFGS